MRALICGLLIGLGVGYGAGFLLAQDAAAADQRMQGTFQKGRKVQRVLLDSGGEERGRGA